ncbi:microtubule-associated protein RP/EB family member 1 [Drosophila mauritiana]|uniref:Microtubule-associated protein RP/EB family member 1 n=1 Tax=Drosophila mauritiana TaxID=7226 RepID=A0A6P8K8M0_DROMA|nr:microtubule-associated protein RP/EB family member 1 [Drosophila mauritiana]
MSKKSKTTVVNVLYTNNSSSNPSRGEMLSWVNNTLKSQFSKVEELCTGAAYCQLMDILFAQSIPMQRVKFRTNVEYEYIQNFKLLQGCFNKVDVDKIIPIDRLVKGRFQDNFEFLQWFRKFFDANYESREYDPLIARNGAMMGLGSPPVEAKKRKSVNKSKPQTKPTEESSAQTDKARTDPENQVHESNSQTKATEEAPAQTDKATTEPVNEGSIEELRNYCEYISIMTEERDFYLSKLRAIDHICQKYNSGQVRKISEKITNIIYSG